MDAFRVGRSLMRLKKSSNLIGPCDRLLQQPFTFPRKISRSFHESYQLNTGYDDTVGEAYNDTSRQTFSSIVTCTMGPLASMEKGCNTKCDGDAFCRYLLIHHKQLKHGIYIFFFFFFSKYISLHCFSHSVLILMSDGLFLSFSNG